MSDKYLNPTKLALNDCKEYFSKVIEGHYNPEYSELSAGWDAALLGVGGAALSISSVNSSQSHKSS